MPKHKLHWWELSVVPIDGEKGRFHVQSESDPEHPNTVDLDEYNHNGWCSCWRFTNMKARYFDGDKPPLFPVHCQHLIAARNWLLNTLLTVLQSSGAATKPAPPPEGTTEGYGYRIVGRPFILNGSFSLSLAETLERHKGSHYHDVSELVTITIKPMEEPHAS